MIPPRGHGCGWIPDLPDLRDRYYEIEPSALVTLPSEIDLREDCSPIENQGDLLTCTPIAITGALEYLEKKTGARFVHLSRLFIYYSARSLSTNQPTDTGVAIRDAVKAVAKYGVCSEEAWSYDEKKVDVRPLPSCYEHAAANKVTSYRRLKRKLDDMRTCLAERYPFVAGFTMYTSFLSPGVERTGVIPMPGSDDVSQGGHAVLAVGYNDANKQFLVRNSQGKNWGDRGYGFLPYEYLLDADLSEDFWTIRS